MALSILDGNQSATTLSTILSSGQHITAHTVVSLGTQAITDISGAVSGSVVSISNLPATQPVSISSVTIGNTVTISGTVTANPTGTQTIAGTVTASISGTVPISISSVTVGNTVNFLSGSDNDANLIENIGSAMSINSIGGITNALPTGTNRIGVVTIGAGTVTIGAGTAQIGSVTASNITGLNNSVGTDGGTPATTNFIKIGGHQDGSNSVEHIVHVSAGGSMKVDASDSTVTFGVIRGTVTVGNSVTISSLPAISGTVTANVGNITDLVGGGYSSLVELLANDTIAVREPAYVTPISGTVTASALKLQTGDNVFNYLSGEEIQEYSSGNPVVAVYASLPNALPTGTNRIGVVTIGAGTVTLGAGTAQIGSVTASISNSVTIASLPAISGTVTASNVINGFDTYSSVTGNLVVGAGFDGAVRIVGFDSSGSPLNLEEGGGVPIISAGNNPIPISGTVTANTFAVQGTAVTTSNFTSTTASTVLATFNAGREVLTIFNEGAGNLHICAGATCTTIAYQVRLSAGDYYEVPNHQTTITHSAVFATAGTARICQVS